MPGEPADYVRFIGIGLPETPDGLRWPDGTEVEPHEWRDLLALRAYHTQTRRARDPGPQRTAMRLLKTFLSPRQHAALKARGSFVVEAASGRAYRITPRYGAVERVTRHGSRWFAALRFCLHDDRADPDAAMPPADLSLAHMLMLLSDEAEFLRLANATTARDQLWNRAYLRNLRRGRLPA